jgi:hypothetical protein
MTKKAAVMESLPRAAAASSFAKAAEDRSQPFPRLSSGAVSGFKMDDKDLFYKPTAKQFRAFNALLSKQRIWRQAGCLSYD